MLYMKRTKVVCTIGPASASATKLKAMIKAGMNVARLNFSHGTHKSHAELMRLVRAAAIERKEPVAILADMQGPKIRLGELPEEGVELKNGEEIEISTSIKVYKSGGPLPVTYSGLHKDLKDGDKFLIDDGLIELVVTGVKGKVISAKVINGGKVSSHKGMNFPDSNLSLSSLTEKDHVDVEFAVQKGVEWVAISFVTSAADIHKLREIILGAAKKGQVLPRIIVKIEKHEAIESFREILDAVDAVMVARGDLGIEIPAEQVPIRQKEIIQSCRDAGKPVVVATQMFDSMIRNPRPTRAEVSDVANAVFDHTDGIMLSGESATGKYPVETVKMMAKVAEEAEISAFDDVLLDDDLIGETEATISHTLKELALGGQINAIVSSIELAPWAERLNTARPELPIHIAAPTKTEVAQMNIRWGVSPFLMKAGKAETFGKRVVTRLRKDRKIKKGQRVAIVFGGEDAEGFSIVEVK